MEQRRGQSRTRSKLSDVASRAGVSASTVSLVLSGKGDQNRISEETQQRVRQAASDLNYAPSLLHRSVRRGKTGILSFYNSFRNREAADLYMDRMSAAVEHAGGRRGYNILVHCHFAPSAEETYAFLNGGFADGLILFSPAPDDPLLAMLRSGGLPTVVLNPQQPESVLATVEDDSAAGVAQIARAIRDSGHRRVAVMVDAFAKHPDPVRRGNQLVADLANHGIHKVDVIGSVFHPSEAVTEFLALPVRPTVLFVWNDRAAYDVLAELSRRGVRVPEDVSVLGYDGIAWPSSTGQIISSVRTSFEGIGDAAIDILQRTIDGEKVSIHRSIPGVFMPGTTLRNIQG